VTPRGTDWSLALLVALGAATGLATWFAGAPSATWVFAAHAVAGVATAAILGVKLRRVRRRRRPSGLVALGLVAASLGSGLAWSSGARAYPGGMSLLVWHGALGAVLAAGVLAHARVRAKPMRRRDVADRRQFLTAAAIAGGSLLAWQVQRPVQRALGLPGARRRFTGSYDAGSFTGNAFPTTSWLADDPRPARTTTVTVDGLVERPLTLAAADLDRGDTIVATLDCTGGFYSTQSWHGVHLRRLLDEARAKPAARHVSVVSRTGYRWSFGLDDARSLLLATRVGDEPLAHGHGAPCRLVAPGRRGLQWVKWVQRIEVREEPDPGALLSTLTSSLTAAGRGAA
jgi:DMSO/TMAO reductase YedYZ molybdopterin-dependent catalytic subunit